MNRTLPTVALSLFSLFAVANLTADARAQAAQAGQAISFSFDGAGKLTGKDNTGATSKTGVRVGGKNYFVGTAGNTGTELADALLAALKKDGYTAQKDANNVVTVTAGPGGVPLTTGGIIGTTDTGLDGIDCKVKKPEPAKKPKKPLKKDGVQVPLPKPDANVKIDLTVTIEIEIEKEVNGKTVVVKVQIIVRLKLGMNAQQIAQAMEEALRKAGLVPNRVVHQSPITGMPVPSFAIDCDVNGNSVQHVVFWQPQQRDLFPVEVAAGDFPMFGGVSYGANSGTCTPGLFLGIQGYPGLGGVFQPFVQNAPAGGFFVPTIGFGEAGLPLLGGDLLVDPMHLLVLPQLPIGLGGTGSFNLPIPPNPAFAGLELFTQGLVVDPQGKACLTNGLHVGIGK